MTAPGYKLDPEALEKAIRELQDVQDSVYELREKTANLSPGELRAGDANTQSAYKTFRDLAVNKQNSLRAELDNIREILEERIKSYEDALEEYKKAEDNASIDAGKIQREA